MSPWRIQLIPDGTAFQAWIDESMDDINKDTGVLWIMDEAGLRLGDTVGNRAP